MIYDLLLRIMEEFDERQAWRDFYDRVRPGIWGGLSRNERRDIGTAERDFHGKRLDRHGQPIRLGAARVARLLDRFAPGLYEVEQRWVFRKQG